MYKSRALSCAIRQLELNTIYNAYSNESPFKYDISILEWGAGSKDMLILLLKEVW